MITKLIPLVLKPVFCGISNRWKIYSNSKSDIWRDTLILGFSGVMFLLIYRITLWALNTLQENSHLASLPLIHPLSAILMILFFMLLTSNIVAGLAFLYFSEDLELLLSTPISKLSLFIGKGLQIFIFSSWMPFIFLFPFLIAFGVHYQLKFEFFLMIPVILIPYFIIPTALGIVIATLVSILLPARRIKIAKISIFFVIIILAYTIISLLKNLFSSLNSVTDISRLLRIFTAPTTFWIPSRWTANIFESLLTPLEYSVYPDYILLFSTSIASVALAHLIIELFHQSAYSASKIEPHSTKSMLPTLTLLLNFIFRFTKQNTRAVLKKEFLTTVRETSHLFEAIMLSGIGLLYLYNLQFLSALKNVSAEDSFSWITTLFLLNTSMNAFLITAICTRFVFPSIAREGRSFWIILSSPMTTFEILRTKRLGWMFPVSFIGLIFATISAVQVGYSTEAVLLSVLFTILVCYNIVSAAIGFGAAFALQNSDHPTQVTGGIGSFLFMLYSCCLILLNMIPTWYLLNKANEYQTGSFSENFAESVFDITIFVAITITIIVANLIIPRFSLKIGCNALEKLRTN
jgi:hypothetical protein